MKAITTRDIRNIAVCELAIIIIGEYIYYTSIKKSNKHTDTIDNIANKHKALSWRADSDALAHYSHHRIQSQPSLIVHTMPHNAQAGV